MASKNKMKRFKENSFFKNVIQPDRDELIRDEFSYKGQWNDVYFRKRQPLILELGCGKGEYAIHLAKTNPEYNIIGIDIKGARFWRGAKTALEENLKNVAFLRISIDLLKFAFETNEVDEIWLTFPDPQLKYKRTKHRLTNINFLNLYKNVLKPQGLIHLKTDSEFLYGYTLGMLHAHRYEIVYSHHDIYGNSYSPKIATKIQTFYEQKFLSEGKKITYTSFKLNQTQNGG